MTEIEIVAGERRWEAHIHDTPATRDFLAQLPLELTLKDFGGSEKIADLPRALARKGAPEAITPKVTIVCRRNASCSVGSLTLLASKKGKRRVVLQRQVRVPLGGNADLGRCAAGAQAAKSGRGRIWRSL